MSHPNDLLLLKVIKVFYDPENAESDIYLKLNKQNVNEQIEYEAKLLNKFIIENSDLINYYSELNKNFDIKNQQKMNYLYMLIKNYNTSEKMIFRIRRKIFYLNNLSNELFVCSFMLPSSKISLPV